MSEVSLYSGAGGAHLTSDVPLQPRESSRVQGYLAHKKPPPALAQP